MKNKALFDYTDHSIVNPDEFEIIYDNPKGLVDILDDTVGGYYKGGHDYKINPFEGKFRDSQIVACSRKVVFDWLYDKKFNKYIRTAAKGGTAIHGIIQAPFIMKADNTEKVELRVRVPSPFNPKISLGGHVDLTKVIFSGKVFIIDIKTIKNLYEIDRFGLNKKHVRQLFLYCYQYSIEYGVPLKDIIPALWYIQRKDNEGNVLEVIDRNFWRLLCFRYNQATVNDMYKKAENIWKLLSKGELPAIDAEGYECENSKSRCPCYNFCYKNGKKYPITKIKDLDTELLEQGKYWK